MAANGRRSADDRLIVELAGGKTVAEAAAAAGVGERTVYRRQEDPEFRRRVVAARAAYLETALAKLAEASCRAAQTLVTLLDSDADSTKLSAARSILDSGLKLREAVEIQERLRRLEEMQERTGNERDRRPLDAA